MCRFHAACRADRSADGQARGFVISAVGRYRSGQTGQTVNLLDFSFEGSNPSLPTIFSAGVA